MPAQTSHSMRTSLAPSRRGTLLLRHDPPGEISAARGRTGRRCQDSGVLRCAPCARCGAAPHPDLPDHERPSGNRPERMASSSPCCQVGAIHGSPYNAPPVIAAARARYYGGAVGDSLWCHCQSSSSARDQSEQSSRRRLADAIGTEALTLFRGISGRTSPHNPVGGLALLDGVRYTLGLHANLMRLPRAARPFPSMSEHLLVSAMPPRTAVDVYSGPAPQ